MRWYEKIIFALTVLLFVAAVVDLLRPFGPDVQYGILGAGLGILCTVLILARQRSETTGRDS